MALKTVNSFALTPEWRYGGSTGKLRLYYSESFVDNESRPVVGGTVGSSGFYREVDITIASLVATVASFVLVTTEDSDHPNVKVTGVIYDADGTRRDTLFEWSVPSNSTVASPTTYALMEAYNDRNTIINPPEFYLDQVQILNFINARLAQIGLAAATNLAQGLVLLSVAAADPAVPRVWGHNDPLVRDALTWFGVVLDATMATPAANDVPIYNAVTGRWEPDQAFAAIPVHATSHEAGGTDPIEVSTNMIADDAVTFAKMQNVAANSVPARAAGTSGDLSEIALAASQLLGRGATGDVAAIVLGTNLSMTGATLNAAGGDSSSFAGIDKFGNT